MSGKLWTNMVLSEPEYERQSMARSEFERALLRVGMCVSASRYQRLNMNGPDCESAYGKLNARDSEYEWI